LRTLARGASVASRRNNQARENAREYGAKKAYERSVLTRHGRSVELKAAFSDRRAPKAINDCSWWRQEIQIAFNVVRGALIGWPSLSGP